ncbi:MAG: tRNA lysidine(34) synthetase TilS [Rhodospirillales bacterium]|nr:tRNA lysidine(34) synthetase TilS [Rhodospirillales bacterium]
MMIEKENRQADVCCKTAPVCSDAFAQMMGEIGFFEANPLVAVGVSGGPDSLALLRLVDTWARAQGGRVIGLTVDHGLRAGSGPEAAWVSRELGNHGIEHHILVWQGKKPASGIQDKARKARRRLMLEWCRDNGVLHLCLGHHANDQVETHLMRMARCGQSEAQSESLNEGGQSGLAGMSLVREYAHARVVRPLLSVSKNRLEATLQSMGQTWLNDPSNDKEQFERVRVRKVVSQMETVGGGVSGMVDSIREFGDIRRDLERLGARTLSASSSLYPAGYARFDPRKLSANGDSAAIYALSRLIMTVGGLRYPVSREKLGRVQQSLARWSSGDKRTIGGCLFCGTDDGVLITREERNLPSPQLVPGSSEVQKIHWDNRFMLSLCTEVAQTEASLSLGKLGYRGWDRLVRVMPDLRRHPVPLSARYALPALFHNDDIISVSHLTKRFPEIHPHYAGFEKATFSSPEPALGGTFSVALTGFCTISGKENAMLVTDERNDA